jgi:hypothetical protein
MIEPDPSATRRVVFQYLVPVHVEVEDGLVVCVTSSTKRRCAIHPWSKAMPATSEAVAAADDGQPWPSWRFGY